MFISSVLLRSRTKLIVDISAILPAALPTGNSGPVIPPNPAKRLFDAMSVALRTGQGAKNARPADEEHRRRLLWLPRRGRRRHSSFGTGSRRET